MGFNSAFKGLKRSYKSKSSKIIRCFNTGTFFFTHLQISYDIGKMMSLGHYYTCFHVF